MDRIAIAARHDRSARWRWRCAAWLLPTAAAADYPDKPIRLIVPQAPGSATDVLARLLGAELGPQLGQTIVIDNRPGGALTLGLDLTAKSAPDGYTLCMGPIGALAITRHMVAKLPYDIERDFQPIALVSRGHLLLAVSTALPVSSVQELVEHAKTEPRQADQRLVEQRLARPCRRRAVQVHDRHRYPARALQGRRAGDQRPDRRPRPPDVREPQLDLVTAKSGKVRGLGVSGPRRSPAFPDLPTIAEAGVPGYDAGTWSGVIAPAGLPKPIVEKLNAAINRAITTPAFKERFGAIGDEPAGGSPEDFVETIAKDSAKWADVISARAPSSIDASERWHAPGETQWHASRRRRPSALVAACSSGPGADHACAGCAPTASSRPAWSRRSASAQQIEEWAKQRQELGPTARRGSRMSTFLCAANAAEFAALGRYSVLLLTVITQKSEELPLARVYIRAKEQDVPMEKVSSWRSDVDSALLAHKIYGPYREAGFYLIPTGMTMREGQLLDGLCGQPEPACRSCNCPTRALPSGSRRFGNLNPAPNAKPTLKALQAVITRSTGGFPVPSSVP